MAHADVPTFGVGLRLLASNGHRNTLPDSIIFYESRGGCDATLINRGVQMTQSNA